MNNLPVVRSPWRIVILLLGFTFLYEASDGVGRLVNALVWRIIAR